MFEIKSSCIRNEIVKWFIVRSIQNVVRGRLLTFCRSRNYNYLHLKLAELMKYARWTNIINIIGAICSNEKSRENSSSFEKCKKKKKKRESRRTYCAPVNCTNNEHIIQGLYLFPIKQVGKHAAAIGRRRIHATLCECSPYQIVEMLFTVTFL